MALKVYEDGNIAAIAEKIREKTGGDKTYKTSEMPEGVGEVYDAGIEQGKKAEYDAFWDAFQNYGKPQTYSRAFGPCWKSVEIFKPKYNIIATSAYMMFAEFPLKIDLVEYFENLGIVLDLSKAENTQYLFQGSMLTRIGVVDVRNSTNSIPLDGAFPNCPSLVTIEKIYLKTGRSGEVSNYTFSNCTALENVTFEGEITANGLNLQWAIKLSKASIENIISVLSTTTSGLSVTLSKAAVNKAFETSEGANDGATSTEWTTLIGTRSNWTVSLV